MSTKRQVRFYIRLYQKHLSSLRSSVSFASLDLFPGMHFNDTHQNIIINRCKQTSAKIRRLVTNKVQNAPGGTKSTRILEQFQVRLAVLQVSNGILTRRRSIRRLRLPAIIAREFLVERFHVC